MREKGGKGTEKGHWTLVGGDSLGGLRSRNCICACKYTSRGRIRAQLAAGGSVVLRGCLLWSTVHCVQSIDPLKAKWKGMKTFGLIIEPTRHN